MKFKRNKTKELAATQATAPAAPEPKAKPPRAPKKLKEKGRGGKAGDKGATGRQKFVLFIGDEGAILVYMRGKTVIRRLFAASPAVDHTGAVLELLRQHPNVPLSILTDVIDQQYVRHTFPPVSALSVSGLVKRRLDRDFQPTDITGSIQLGRDKTGRKEWQYLLIALAITPLMQQWLDVLTEMPNELKGIYLVPVEAQNFIAALHGSVTKEKPQPWQLLVSHHKVSGFRQVVLKNGKLVFTRVTQAIDDAVPAVIAGNIEQEIMNTLEYLRRLGFLENNTLELLVIASQEVQVALDVNRFNAGRSMVMTPLDVADQLGFEQAALSADRFGDVVMAASFARSRASLKLMTAYATRLSQLYMARLGIKVLGVLAVVALLGMSVMNVMESMSLREEASKAETQRAPVTAQLATVRAALDGLNKDVTFKSAVMLTFDAYMKDRHAPQEFVDAMAPLLTPEVRVRDFNWIVAGSGAIVDAVPNAAPSAPPPAPAPAPGAAPATPGLLDIKLDLEFTGRYAKSEDLALSVSTFLATLKDKLPQYNVTHAPFAWEGKTPTNLEISFDQPQPVAPAIAEGENKITLYFSGPNPVTPGATPAPGATP